MPVPVEAGQKQRCRRALRLGESHSSAQNRLRLLDRLLLTDDRSSAVRACRSRQLGPSASGDAGLLRDRRGDLLAVEAARPLSSGSPLLAADQRLQPVAQLCGLLKLPL